MTTSDFKTTKDISSLTGLRGFAALIVYISHCANHGLLPEFLGGGFGQVGVMLFFVLSGFLMAFLYLDKNPTEANVKEYCLARIGRVLPLYYALLLLSVLISTVIHSDLVFAFQFNSAGTILRALLLIDARYVFWTIPVEVQFYVIFLFLWYVKHKFGNTISIIFLPMLLTALSLAVYNFTGKIPQIVTTYIVAFQLGVLFHFTYYFLSSNK